MGYFDLTIQSLDRIIDDVERQRSALYQSNHKQEAGDLAAVRDYVTSVRDRLVARQHDLDRKEDRPVVA